jgi:hypothetical protein
MLLTNPPTPDNIIKVTRDREFFNMLKAATYSGIAYHVVESNSTGQSGHAVLDALTTWYGRAEVSRTIIDHYRSKIQTLRLNESTTGTAFSKDFILCANKLLGVRDKSEGFTPATKLSEFLDEVLK